MSYVCVWNPYVVCMCVVMRVCVCAWVCVCTCVHTRVCVKPTQNWQLKYRHDTNVDLFINVRPVTPPPPPAYYHFGFLLARGY